MKKAYPAMYVLPFTDGGWVQLSELSEILMLRASEIVRSFGFLTRYSIGDAPAIEFTLGLKVITEPVEKFTELVVLYEQRGFVKRLFVREDWAEDVLERAKKRAHHHSPARVDKDAREFAAIFERIGYVVFEFDTTENGVEYAQKVDAKLRRLLHQHSPVRFDAMTKVNQSERDPSTEYTWVYYNPKWYTYGEATYGNKHAQEKAQLEHMGYTQITADYPSVWGRLYYLKAIE